MSTLILGLVLFLGVHSIAIVAPAWRNDMLARLGPLRWKLAYGFLSLLGFYLILRGYAQARQAPTVLWVPGARLRDVAAALMLPVFPLLLAAYLPGRIRDKARHPMLAATKFWALAHLLVNGMLVDVVLFGSILAWAIVDRVSAGRRDQKPMQMAPRGRWNDWIALLGGLALYVAFTAGLHKSLIGVAPFPS